MTKEEYEAMRASVLTLLKEVDRIYIIANTDIEPGSLVMAAGQRCVLKSYKVVGGVIYPVLVTERNKNKKVYVSANAIITKI